MIAAHLSAGGFMRYLTFFCLLISLLLLLPCQLLAEDGALSVEEISITTRIIRGNPVDAVQRISSSAIKEIYCFTKVVSPDDGQREIIHAWYRKDELISRFRLPVSGTSWRTYSKKLVTPDMAGEWRVEVLDSDENLLKTTKFILN
ncbi:MAG: DUF2914 domain-containing protein [Deltaproteobacteria bacterium]|nr:DUF2914 domain-containing protein [Deltaproteobacteria bacterium]TLN05155.1 MAG: DUF2914 domain-containing protein [bacterium]